METDLTAAEIGQMAEQFAGYEYRQVDIAVRQGDLEDDALDQCDDDGWLLDSLSQHPDTYLPDTVGRPDLPADVIGAALTRYWSGQ